MNRRTVVTALTASALFDFEARAAEPSSEPNTYLETATWQLHNSGENQRARLSDYLENGLAPTLARTGSKLAGAGR